MIAPTTKFILIGALTGGAALGFLYWRLEHPPMKFAANVAIVADRSDSMSEENASILGLADASLNRSRAPQGSTLTVLATGEGRSANEPLLIAKYEIPFSRNALEGKGALLKRKREILIDLRTKVEELKQTNRSPIFIATKRAIEELRGGGCRRDSQCSLYIRTDGEELSERSVTESINSRKNRTDLPSPIPNEGIQVEFCGLAEGNNSRNSDTGATAIHGAKRGDRLREVWSSLFTSPDHVTFKPYCPKGDVTRLAGK